MAAQANYTFFRYVSRDKGATDKYYHAYQTTKIFTQDKDKKLHEEPSSLKKFKFYTVDPESPNVKAAIKILQDNDYRPGNIYVPFQLLVPYNHTTNTFSGTLATFIHKDEGIFEKGNLYSTIMSANLLTDIETAPQSEYKKDEPLVRVEGTDNGTYLIDVAHAICGTDIFKRLSEIYNSSRGNDLFNYNNAIRAYYQYSTGVDYLIAKFKRSPVAIETLTLPLKLTIGKPITGVPSLPYINNEPAIELPNADDAIIDKTVGVTVAKRYNVYSNSKIHEQLKELFKGMEEDDTVKLTTTISSDMATDNEDIFRIIEFSERVYIVVSPHRLTKLITFLQTKGIITIKKGWSDTTKYVIGSVAGGAASVVGKILAPTGDYKNMDADDEPIHPIEEEVP